MRRYWGIGNDNQTKLDVDETKRNLMDMALASNLSSFLISGLVRSNITCTHCFSTSILLYSYKYQMIKT